MSKRTDRLAKRNEKITERFVKLSDKKYNGKVKLYTQPAILSMLSEEFHLAERTIENIVFCRVEYKENQ